jgi:hypothetical protein
MALAGSVAGLRIENGSDRLVGAEIGLSFLRQVRVESACRTSVFGTSRTTRRVESARGLEPSRSKHTLDLAWRSNRVGRRE